MNKRIAFAFVWLLSTGLCVAQPPVAPAQPAAAPAAPAAAAPAAAQGSSFADLFGRWEKLLARLQTLQVDYKNAKPDARRPLREEFEKLVAEGEALQPQLVQAAEVAYRAAPNKDTNVSDVLVSALGEDLENDDYDHALPIAKLLIEHKYDNPRIFNQAGIAAYGLDEFKAAHDYFHEAEEKNALDARGRELHDAVDTSLEKWQKEEEIRAKEAKADDLPRVELKTNKGTIVIELFENEAPNTVANFISLVEKKFFDGLAFHRVLPHFIAQGGDPKGDGTGGPGYTIACECHQPNARTHFRGSLSMAHAGRDTGGSQFFLTFIRTPHLDGQHTVFGRVISGFDVLSKLQRRDPSQPNQPAPDKILEARVLRKRSHAYEPVKKAEKS